jgi:hypothetical protein
VENAGVGPATPGVNRQRRLMLLGLPVLNSHRNSFRQPRPRCPQVAP